MNPRSFIGPAIRPIERAQLMRANGTPKWHGLTPYRFVTPLPPVQNPIRARADRAVANMTLKTADPFGTPQLNTKREPYRNSGGYNANERRAAGRL